MQSHDRVEALRSEVGACGLARSQRHGTERLVEQVLVAGQFGPVGGTRDLEGPDRPGLAGARSERDARTGHRQRRRVVVDGREVHRRRGANDETGNGGGEIRKDEVDVGRHLDLTLERHEGLPSKGSG